MRSIELAPKLPIRCRRSGRYRARGRRGSRERGVVLFVCLILLLVLTVLGVSLARQQTVEERLSQNEFNHEIALQTAQAMLQAAYDAVGGALAQGDYTGGTMPGLATLSQELAAPPYTTLDRGANWDSPGTNTISYNQGMGYGAPMPAVPAAAQPQFVVEDLPVTPKPGMAAGTPGGYQGGGTELHMRRITAHAAGADGSASATVQIIRYVGG
jgi:Tfp pilus assembly protein PilX